MAAVEAVTAAFAGVLQRNRERFNALFAQSQATSNNVDPSAFVQHLREVVDPIAGSVARVEPDRLDDAISVTYERSLELIAAGLLGPQARHSAIVDGWKRVLPPAARLVARDPHATIAAITNALYNLSLHPGARADIWVDEMAAIASEVSDVAAFRAAGHILAWRCGMAQHRLSALTSCATLPGPLALRALGVTGDATRLPDVLARLRQDPWMTPARAFEPAAAQDVALVHIAGAFRGFGGVFLRPPRVFATSDDDLIATDSIGYWVLVADVFGSAILPLASPPAPRSPSPTDTARFEVAKLRFQGLAGATSFAGDSKTLAITIDQSHQIFFVGMR